MRVFLLALALLLSPLAAQAADLVGVVLMHGKWGNPNNAITVLSDKLESAGVLVARPEMPWSRGREYDADYAQAMDEITAAITKLRAKGATRVVVAGHSMGANAALGYAARHDDVAGIVAIAPGHSPELFAARLGASIAKAQAMVAQGKGDETAQFDDLNQGKTKPVTCKARVYASYFDTQGPAVMPVNAAAFKRPTPLLWVVGVGDPLYPRGEDYAFNKAPFHPDNRYLVVEGGHMDTPTIAADQIVEWIKGITP
ncbi:alpha/beta hydrolase [Magnetospirillum sp. 64-120]|uniref:alpha/beta hydrolase n=1 Tax=Magnetospirillum sp. 64-120 TaxID=1895778 RepID=UPI000925CF2C|nr:alpha/beta hydrolase [Magnetospirillum sp. 64-120]OJX79479.1 MAG: hypothetical protein BGO92_13495 [Magnetospirillum sp. 64-120]